MLHTVDPVLLLCVAAVCEIRTLWKPILNRSNKKKKLLMLSVVFVFFTLWKRQTSRFFVRFMASPCFCVRDFLRKEGHYCVCVRARACVGGGQISTAFFSALAPHVVISKYCI